MITLKRTEITLENDYSVHYYQNEEAGIDINVLAGPAESAKLAETAFGKEIQINLDPNLNELDYTVFLMEDSDDYIRYATPSIFDDRLGYGIQLVLELEQYALIDQRVVTIVGLDT